MTDTLGISHFFYILHIPALLQILPRISADCKAFSTQICINPRVFLHDLTTFLMTRGDGYDIFARYAGTPQSIFQGMCRAISDTGMAGTALGVCDRGIAGQRGIGQKRRKPYGRTILWCYQPVVFTDPAETGSGGNRLM